MKECSVGSKIRHTKSSTLCKWKLIVQLKSIIFITHRKLSICSCKTGESVHTVTHLGIQTYRSWSIYIPIHKILIAKSPWCFHSLITLKFLWLLRQEHALIFFFKFYLIIYTVQTQILNKAKAHSYLELCHTIPNWMNNPSSIYTRCVW